MGNLGIVQLFLISIIVLTILQSNFIADFVNHLINSYNIVSLDHKNSEYKFRINYFSRRPGKPGLDGLDIPLEPEPSFPWFSPDFYNIICK